MKKENPKQEPKKPGSEIPGAAPSFIPEPGYDTIGNNTESPEYPVYEEPLPAGSPAEIGDTQIKEF
jgi:hypothetical protein